MSKSKEDWIQMINDCESREEELSEWEGYFIDSISNWLSKHDSITSKQERLLNKIWEKATKWG